MFFIGLSLMTAVWQLKLQSETRWKWYFQFYPKVLILIVYIKGFTERHLILVSGITTTTVLMYLDNPGWCCLVCWRCTVHNWLCVGRQTGFILPVIAWWWHKSIRKLFVCIPDSKVYGAYMGPTLGRQDPGGPHVGPMILAIWDVDTSTRCRSKRLCNTYPDFISS